MIEEKKIYIDSQFVKPSQTNDLEIINLSKDHLII